MLNLDTHIVLYMALGKLRRAEHSYISRSALGISAIVLWEIAELHHRRRIRISLQDPVFTDILASLHVWNITPEVCDAIGSLDFESDPADELIAATSIAHNVPLLTRDTRILESRIVPLALR